MLTRTSKALLRAIAALFLAWAPAQASMLLTGAGTRAPVDVPVAPTPTGTPLYVSGASPTTLAAGVDSGNCQTIGSPCATMTYAATQVPGAGNVTVYCDGTFAENTSSTNRWSVQGNFTAPILVRSYDGNAAHCILTNTSSTGAALMFQAARANNWKFRYVTIRSAVDGHTIASSPNSSGVYPSNIGFFDSVIEAKTASAAKCAVIFSTDFGVQGMDFVRDTFKATVGTSTTAKPKILCISVTTVLATNVPHSNIGFYNNTIDNSATLFDDFGSNPQGIAGFVAYGNNFNIPTGCTNCHAFLLGADASGGATSNITNCYVGFNAFSGAGSNTHGLELGQNVACTAEWNSVTTNLQGIVVKGSTGNIVRSNLVIGNTGCLTLLYAKAATSTTFSENVVSGDGSSSSCTGIKEGVDGSNKSSNTTALDNKITISGASGAAYYFGNSTESTGGATVDRQAITLSNSAKYGQVRATTAITTLANVRTAWGSVGLSGDSASNDANSQ